MLRRAALAAASLVLATSSARADDLPPALAALRHELLAARGVRKEAEPAWKAAEGNGPAATTTAIDPVWFAAPAASASPLPFTFDPASATLFLPSLQPAAGPAEATTALAIAFADASARGRVAGKNADADRALVALRRGDAAVLAVEMLAARAHADAPWGERAAIATVAATAEAIVSPVRTDDPAAATQRRIDQLLWRYGAEYVAWLRRTQPWARVDDVYRKPLRSTEQLMHPQRPGRDAPDEPRAVKLTVPRALRGYELARTSTWGELGLLAYLETMGVADPAALDAAAGWGGDTAAVLTRAGAAPIGLLALDFDADADTAEAEEAFTRVAPVTVIRAGARLYVAIGLSAEQRAALTAELSASPASRGSSPAR